MNDQRIKRLQTDKCEPRLVSLPLVKDEMYVSLPKVVGCQPHFPRSSLLASSMVLWESSGVCLWPHSDPWTSSSLPLDPLNSAFTPLHLPCSFEDFSFSFFFSHSLADAGRRCPTDMFCPPTTVFIPVHGSRAHMWLSLKAISLFTLRASWLLQGSSVETAQVWLQHSFDHNTLSPPRHQPHLLSYQHKTLGVSRFSVFVSHPCLNLFL